MSLQPLKIVPYRPGDQLAIRTVLQGIGWEAHYIAAFEQAAKVLSAREDAAVLMANQTGHSVGFIFAELHVWNNLVQIQGLAVDPVYQRQGVASALVARAEAFAGTQGARGIYVDTPTSNTGGRRFYEALGYQAAYVMPRYYSDTLDGVTYQKFFGQS
jgi:ribosomal protein S18 acetylase RimI-like enzyme